MSLTRSCSFRLSFHADGSSWTVVGLDQVHPPQPHSARQLQVREYRSPVGQSLFWAVAPTTSAGCIRMTPGQLCRRFVHVCQLDAGQEFGYWAVGIVPERLPMPTKDNVERLVQDAAESISEYLSRRVPVHLQRHLPVVARYRSMASPMNSALSPSAASSMNAASPANDLAICTARSPPSSESTSSKK